MEEELLNQSSPTRAWKDTKEAFHKIWFFWVVQVLAIGVFTITGKILTPANSGGLANAMYPTFGGIIGAIIGFGIIYLIYLIKAPYKQRNEARSLLYAKPKAMPLQNRKELREAIASVENSTVQLVNRKNELAKTDAKSPYLAQVMARADEAYDFWNESMNKLRRQYLIAGGVYKSICVEFTGYIWAQVAVMMDYAKPPQDFQPNTVENMWQFVGKVGGIVKETLRKIDEISA